MEPSFEHEDGLPGSVAGVDEVGRGPWAGPVVAAAVILDRSNVPAGLRDSKTLSPARREALATSIEDTAVVGLGVCSVEEIDEGGVGRATLLAMSRAVDALCVRPDTALIDGTVMPSLPSGMAAQTLPRADALCPSVAAASIVAKVYRDTVMTTLARSFPAYAWDRNKGYGTKDHAEALDRHGVTVHHRRSFAPISRRVALTRR